MRRILAALILVAVCGTSGSAQKPFTPAAQLGAIIQQAQVELDFEGAIPRYTKFIADNSANAQLTAKALYYLGQAYEEVGRPAEARTAFERVAKQFSTQKEAPLALAKLESGVARETTVRISDSDFIDRFSRPSPDGRYLVGPRPGGNGTRDLVLHDPATNTDRRLTRGGFAFSPRFTPDGRRVVFQWSSSDDAFKAGGIHEIRMVNVDGTGERTIFRSSLYKSLEVSGVSADGKTAAVGFNRTDDTWQVGLVSLETGTPTILKNNEWRDTYVGNFSPDGRWLVYWRQGEERKFGNGGIYALATDGSREHPLISARAVDEAPYFTPDGSRVVFVSGSHDELWSIRVVGGRTQGPQEQVHRGGFAQLLGFSRDGSLYFTDDRSHTGVFIADVNPANWKSLGAPTEVSTADRDKGFGAAAGSPNGQVLAYQLWACCGPANSIMLHRFDGTPDRELSFTEPVALHGWSSDGRLLISPSCTAARCSPPPGTDLNLYDVETGRKQLLVGEMPLDSLSRGGYVDIDESAVYYYTWDRDAKSVHLMRLGMRTGERRELYQGVAGVAPPRLYRVKVSPDGRSVGFGFPDQDSSGDHPLQSGVLVPLSGGAPRPLPGFAAWTPDSKAVLFEKSPGEIWVQPIDGGEMYATGIRFDRPGEDMALVVHPDGRRIALVRRVNTHDVRVIRNPFSKRSSAQ